MSRRRKLPPQPPGTIRAGLVSIVCTDAGQHPEATLHRFLDGRDIGLGDVLLSQGGHPVTPWHPEDGRPTFRFTCRRCRRDTELREPVLLAVISARREARPGELPSVDVSLLT